MAVIRTETIQYSISDDTGKKIFYDDESNMIYTMYYKGDALHRDFKLGPCVIEYNIDKSIKSETYYENDILQRNAQDGPSHIEYVNNICVKYKYTDANGKTINKHMTEEEKLSIKPKTLKPNSKIVLKLKRLNLK